MIKKKQIAKTNDDLVVYKVTAAFILMVAALFLLRKLGSAYQLMDNFEPIYKLSKIGAIVFGILSACFLAVHIVFRKRRTLLLIGSYGFVLSLLLAATGFILRKYWTGGMLTIYFLHAFVYCLYMVYELYLMEFTLFSLVAAWAGFVFFLYSRGFAANARSISVAVILVLICAVVAYISWNTGKNKGKLIVLGRKKDLFSSRFSPVLLYIICAVSIVLYVAVLLLGVTFSYYCMFAVIALELIAAVYYTFQLK